MRREGQVLLWELRKTGSWSNIPNNVPTNVIWIIWWTLGIGQNDIEVNSSAHWQQKFVLSYIVSCFQQACSIGFSHTNARKRYNVDSKNRRTGSKLQAKEASLMSHGLWLFGFQYPNCKPNCAGSTILVEDSIVCFTIPTENTIDLINLIDYEFLFLPDQSGENRNIYFISGKLKWTVENCFF